MLAFRASNTALGLFVNPTPAGRKGRTRSLRTLCSTRRPAPNAGGALLGEEDAVDDATGRGILENDIRPSKGRQGNRGRKHYTRHAHTLVTTQNEPQRNRQRAIERAHERMPCTGRYTFHPPAQTSLPVRLPLKVCLSLSLCVFQCFNVDFNVDFKMCLPRLNSFKYNTVTDGTWHHH